MAQIQIEIKGLKQIQSFLKNYPAESKDKVRKAVNKSLRTVESKAIIEAPVNTGELRAKRRVVSSHQGGMLEFYAKHAVPLHEGSRPHMPPIRKGKGLELWARKKGISPWAIAFSIKRKGTKANKFLQRAIMKSEKEINTIFNNAIKLISKSIKK